MMTTIILKPSQSIHYPSIHHWLAEQLQLPEYYGHNLDALWDCLSGDIALPLHIIWQNDCEDEADFSSIIQLFQEVAAEIDGLSFQYIDN